MLLLPVNQPWRPPIRDSHVSAPRRVQATTGPRARRLKARRAVLLGLLSIAAAFAGLDFALDYATPSLRDPEYGRRASRWHARIAEHPHRPVVLTLGSSRVSMGLRPSAWEAARPAGDSAPMILNMSGVGMGPVGQVMFLRRILAEGPPPDAIVLEFWPPFLHDAGKFSEQARTDLLRLGPVDHPYIEQFFLEPDAARKRLREIRRNPFFEYRYRLLAQINPRWNRWGQRFEFAWADLDPWGWLPAVKDDAPGVNYRPLRIAKCFDYYDELFKTYRIDPRAERAYREIVALARERNIRVAFLFMPESEEFLAWYPPEVENESQAFLARLVRELEVPLIDARFWLPNDSTCDGFHLFPTAAGAFTQRLGTEVMTLFPDLRRRTDR